MTKGSAVGNESLWRNKSEENHTTILRVRKHRDAKASQSRIEVTAITAARGLLSFDIRYVSRTSYSQGISNYRSLADAIVATTAQHLIPVRD